MKDIWLWAVFGIVGFVDALILIKGFDGPLWAGYAVSAIALMFPLYGSFPMYAKFTKEEE